MSFSGFLSEPQAPQQRSVPIQTGGDLADLANVASKGLDLFQILQGRQKAAAQEAVKQANAAKVAGLQSSLVDIELESLQQNKQRGEIVSQVAAMSADGSITPEEAKRIETLQKQEQRLQLLDPRNQRIRRLSLYKEALSDPQNYNILPQIQAMFEQARGHTIGTDSIENTELKSYLDNIYGEGQYGAVEEGRAIGRLAYINNQMQTASTNINRAVANAGTTAATLTEVVYDKAHALYKKQGHITTEQRTALLAEIEKTQMDFTAKLADVQKAYAEKGIDVSEKVQEARERADTFFSASRTPIQGEGLFGDNVATKNFLATELEILHHVRELASPVPAEVVAAFASGGIDIRTMQETLRVLDQNDANLRPITAELGMTVDELRANLLKTVAAAGDFTTLQESVEAGFNSPRLMSFYVFNVGLKTVNDAPAADEQIEAVSESPFTQQEDVINALLQAKTVQNLRDKDVKKIQPVALNYARQIVSEMSPKEKEALIVNSNGEIFVELGDLRVGGSSTKAFINDKFNLLNKLVRTYEKQVGGRESFLRAFRSILEEGREANEGTAADQ